MSKDQESLGEDIDSGWGDDEEPESAIPKPPKLPTFGAGMPLPAAAQPAAAAAREAAAKPRASKPPMSRPPSGSMPAVSAQKSQPRASKPPMSRPPSGSMPAVTAGKAPESKPRPSRPPSGSMPAVTAGKASEAKSPAATAPEAKPPRSMPRPPVAPPTKSGTEQPIFEAPKSSPRAEQPAAPLGEAMAPEKARTPAAPEKATFATSANQKEEELVAFLTASLISLNQEATVPDERGEAAPISTPAVVEPPSRVAAEPAVPHVAASRSTGAQRRLGWIGRAAALVLLGGIGVAVGVAWTGRSKPPAQVAVAAVEEPRRDPPKPVAAPAERPTPPEKPRETTAPSEPSPADPAASAVSATEESGVTKVTLTVTPPEAKAARPGRLPEKTPVTYEIPKGSRIMVNVSCYGYQSKELVLDGSKTEISLNLQRKAGGAPETAP